MDGGAVLGYGKDGTRLYTGDDIIRAYPGLSTVCVNFYPSKSKTKTKRCGGASQLERILGQDNKARDLAIKDVQDGEDAHYELGVNALVRRVFTAEGVDEDLCPLHPEISCIDVKFREWPERVRTHRLLVYKALYGDASHLQLDDGSLLRCAADVLTSLAALHRHDHAHLDVKPQNVLLRPRPRSRSLTAGARFVLSDFGLLSRMDAVKRFLLVGPASSSVFAQQESTSRYIGTPGFMSPVMSASASANANAMDKVRCLVRVAGLDKKYASPGHFSRARLSRLGSNPEIIGKLDLHSLGLTLLDLLLPLSRFDKSSPDKKSRRPQTFTLQDLSRFSSISSRQAEAKTATLLERALRQLPETTLDFLCRLFFFRKRDFRSAPDALAFVQNLIRT